MKSHPTLPLRHFERFVISAAPRESFCPKCATFPQTSFFFFKVQSGSNIYFYPPEQLGHLNSNIPALWVFPSSPPEILSFFGGISVFPGVQNANVPARRIGGVRRKDEQPLNANQRRHCGPCLSGSQRRRALKKKKWRAEWVGASGRRRRLQSSIHHRRIRRQIKVTRLR